MTNTSLVELTDVSVGYHAKRVISEVNASFQPGTLSAMVGPNGAGKSTLLKSIAGVVPFDGTISIDGAALKSYSRRDKVKQVAFVAQHGNAESELTVKQVVELSRMASKRPFERQSEADRNAIERAVEHADISHLMGRVWNTLSGGEQQRVQLARAISQSAKVLVLDEPTNHLDIHHQFRLMEQLQHLAKDHDVCVVVALHDLGLAARFCDHVVMIANSTIAAQGPPTDVLIPERLREVFGVDAELVELCGHRELAVHRAVHDWWHRHEPKESL